MHLCAPDYYMHNHLASPAPLRIQFHFRTGSTTALHRCCRRNRQYVRHFKYTPRQIGKSWSVWHWKSHSFWLSHANNCEKDQKCYWNKGQASEMCPKVSVPYDFNPRFIPTLAVVSTRWKGCTTDSQAFLSTHSFTYDMTSIGIILHTCTDMHS